MPDRQPSPPRPGPAAPGESPPAAPGAAGSIAASGPASAARLPLVLLALLAAVPALAVLPAFRAGGPVFTLYREPKLAAAQALLWALLVALAWHRQPPVGAMALRSALVRPPLILLALFVAWSAATALWVTVPANLLYELIQYASLGVLLAVLVAWGERERRLRGVIVRALAASLGVVTVIGFVQLAAPISWLPPIDPQYGVSNPSLMGYKNPMALALLGQVYLLARLAAGGSGRRRLAWGLLLGAELVYLATLQSRTAYAALALSALLLVAVAIARRGVAWRRRAAVLAVTVALGGLFAAAVALHPGARARLGSAVQHATSPAEYLASDRGTYLLNTLNMVDHRPLGVGLGDWQSWYPLFRRHDRYRSFSDAFQARRAHSDLVQLLGETGWPGLALWLAFLAAAVGSALGRFLRRGDTTALFAGVQLAALVFAMGSDYLVEMPYHKLQLFLVGAVALIRPPSEGAPAPAAAPVARARSAISTAAAVAVTAIATAAVAWSACSLVRAGLAAGIEQRYLAMLAHAAPAGGERPIAIARGDELTRLAAAGGGWPTRRRLGVSASAVSPVSACWP